MSEYLAPGVFVEEVSFRSKSIEGVGTSVAGFVGPTRFGPLRGVPEVVTSYGEFEKIFGDPWPLKLKQGDDEKTVPNYSALAVRAFFENGGKQLYFTRIVAGGNDTNAYGTGGSASVAKATAAGSNISFEARYPGGGGDLDIQIIWQDQENLFRSRSYVNFDLVPVGAEGVITTKAIAEADFVGDPSLASDKFPLKQLTALVKKTDAGFEFLADTKKEVVDAADAAVTLTDTLSTGIKKAALATLAFEFKQVWVNTPSGGAALADTPFELVLSGALDTTRFITPEPINNKLLRGTLNAGLLSLKVLSKGAAPETPELKDIPLALFAAFPNSVKSLKLQRQFSLIAIRRKKTLKDPTGAQDTVAVPPSGFIAGVYARTDVDRGVHKAPANTPVLGALRFAQNINKFQQELLNPKGINALRSFSGRGHQVWGGRTLSSDPEWKYVNVRRYFLYLERSIEKGTQWAVFEPNGERLWANLVTTIESFLFNEWKSGRLLGAQPAAAYFVRCDRTTMSQNDLDNGRLIAEVGVAALTPAEFVIFRIGQKTADA